MRWGAVGTKRTWPLALVVFLALAIASPAFAHSTISVPWEGPLHRLVNSLSGPVARAFTILGIVISGTQIVFGDGVPGIRTLVFTCIATIVIFGISSFFLGFLGFTGGAVL